MYGSDAKNLWNLKIFIFIKTLNEIWKINNNPASIILMALQKNEIHIREITVSSRNI